MFQNIRFPKHLGPDLLEKNMRHGSSSKAIGYQIVNRNLLLQTTCTFALIIHFSDLPN